MKITVKTLKHDQFQLDVDSEDTILSVKQKIKETKDHDVPLQKLIYSGSILVDDKKLSDYNITEKDFMVLVVSKPSPKTSAGSSSTGNKTATPDTVKGSTTSTTVKETSTQKTDAIQSSATTTTPTTTDANTTTTTTTTTATETTTASNTPTTGLFDNPNALVTGADYERAVQNMVEMGFDRELVVSAMRASFNNPNRAVEYLMSGIPELDNNPPTTTPSATTQPNVDTTATTTTTTAAATNPMPGLTNPASTTGAPNLSSQPLNLFQQAQNLQRQRATQGGGGGGGGQGGGNIDDLNFLRNQPHFRSLRQFIQQNPGSLQPLLQQIGSTNPELLQLINSNPGMFMRLLQEPDEGEPQVVSVTQEEKEAIDRLEALGFDRALAIEAYLACDKNEEMAANFLFDHMNDDEN